jgi:hypothetical protein
MVCFFQSVFDSLPFLGTAGNEPFFQESVVHRAVYTAIARLLTARDVMSADASARLEERFRAHRRSGVYPIHCYRRV